MDNSDYNMYISGLDTSSIVLNIPHSSTYIPAEHRKRILLSDEELKAELELLTDIDVDKMFTSHDRVIAKYSRLICDTERFEYDEQEGMSKLGMGAVYTKTSNGQILRETDEKYRKGIIEQFYHPYHKLLEESVSNKLEKFNRCILVDCHSYSERLPYITDGNVDICIGTDDFHTDTKILEIMADMFKEKGYTVGINKPFSGSMVPTKYYMKDKRVKTVMIEINKRMYTESGESIASKVMELSNMFKSILEEIEKKA